MEIKEYIKERIVKNQLDLDINKCVELVSKYEKIYPGVDEMKRFFYVILNKVGSILNEIDDDLSEILGWLKVRGRKDIIFFEFDDEEDYLNWLQARVLLYSKIKNIDDLRLINFLELSTMNFITDINTNCTYEILKENDIQYFKKVGYGTDQDTLSFIRYIGSKFKEGYTFKPVKL